MPNNFRIILKISGKRFYGVKTTEVVRREVH